MRAVALAGFLLAVTPPSPNGSPGDSLELNVVDLRPVADLRRGDPRASRRRDGREQQRQMERSLHRSKDS